MKPIELSNKINNPHDYWPRECGFPDGVNSYDEFKKAIEWFEENSATFYHTVFRGESKYYKTYCKPSIIRFTAEFTKNYTEKNIITDQEINSALLSSASQIGENIFFRTQHYGGQTRLLDVTKAQEVALFFACESNFDEDGYVYFFFGATVISLWAPETNSMDSILKYYNFMERDDVCYLLDTYKKRSKRMKSQLGRFICWQDPTQPIPVPLYIIRIKHSAKKQILREIRKYGYSPEKLFPDLYGVWIDNKISNS